MKNLLISISGPTAIGKTISSIHLAKEINSDIISFDSRQFYKEMSIGTAVPMDYELNQAKHHFIQHKSVHDDYNISEFSNDATLLINKLFKKNKYIVLVGGSYLYLKSILYGIDKLPTVPNSVRDELLLKFKNNGIQYLQNKLKSLDKDYYKKVDLMNHRRLIRALEICMHTKKPFSSYLKNNIKKKYNHISISLNMDREKLYKKINNRVDHMVSTGLIEEARSLHVFRHLKPLNTIGYKELFNYFEGSYSKEKAIDEIKMNSRRFAKKQITWLNNNDNHNWVDPSLPVDILINKLTQIIR